MLCWQFNVWNFSFNLIFLLHYYQHPLKRRPSWASVCRGGVTPRMINGLARADGDEACFKHEGFNLHASEILATVTSSAGILMLIPGLLSQPGSQLHLNAAVDLIGRNPSHSRTPEPVTPEQRNRRNSFTAQRSKNPSSKVSLQNKNFMGTANNNHTHSDVSLIDR